MAARRQTLGLATVLLMTVAGCLDGDPNPTGEQASSSSGQSPSPAATISPSSNCSTQTSAQAVNLPFRNNFTDRSIALFWVDSSCREIAYPTIGPRQSYVQQTYVGHVWRVRDVGTHALYKEVTPFNTAPAEVTVP